MMNNAPEQINYVIILLALAKDSILGFIGGVVAYLFDIKKADKAGSNIVFSPASLLLNAVLGAFIGYVLGTFLPPDTFARDGIVALGGLVAFPVLLLAESRVAVMIVDKFLTKK